MRKSRALILVLLIAFVFSSFLGADDGVWWDGMPMTAFRYNGLQNVKEGTIDRLLQPYLGEPFSDSIFSEMMSIIPYIPMRHRGVSIPRSLCRFQ